MSFNIQYFYNVVIWLYICLTINCLLKWYYYARKYKINKKYLVAGNALKESDDKNTPDENKGHERLIQVRKELGLNQTDFANPIGLTQSGLSAIELETAPLRRTVALAIETAYGFRHQWLLYGKLPKHTKFRLTAEEKRVLDLYRSAEKDVQRVTIKLLESTAQCNQPWDGVQERRDSERRENDVSEKPEKPSK